jgi:hypothetical protein
MKHSTILRGAVTTALALASAVVATTVSITVLPPQAHADSSVNGGITRTEILARAQYWVDSDVVYGTRFDSNGNVISTRSAPDSSGRSYRTDCSGLVAMAWHLSWSPTTHDFQNTADHPWKRLGSVHDLLPGDAMVRDGHIELFARWKDRTDHTRGAYVYSLNGPADQDWAKGPAPNSHGDVGINSWSEMSGYTPIRYERVIDDTGAAVSSAGDVAMLRLTSGAMVDYRLGADGWIWGSGQPSAGAAFGAWVRIGNRGGFAGRPRAVIGVNNTIAVYARGSDNKVYGVGQSSPGAAFGNWGLIGTGQPELTGDPSVVLTPSGEIAVYARGGDGWVWGSGQSSPGSVFGAWVRIGAGGAGIASSPQAVVAANGTIAVYARGTDNQVRGVGQPAPGAAFGSWTTIGTGQTAAAGSPRVVVTPNGTMAVYTLGADGWVWGSGQTRPGSVFGGWSRMGTGGSGIASSPEALVAPNGTIAIYARTTDGKVRGVGQPSPGAAFGAWTAIGAGQPAITGDPSAVVSYANTVVVHAATADAVWGTAQSAPGATFAGWIRIGA